MRFFPRCIALQCGGLGWSDEGKNAELLHMQRGLMMLHEACNDTVPTANGITTYFTQDISLEFEKKAISLLVSEICKYVK